MGLVGILNKGNKYLFSSEKINTRILYLFLLFVINFIYYFFSIIYNPGFSSDDFYIFSLTAKNPLVPVCRNPDEIFFLFLRPVSYFSFWLDYTLFGNNSFLMKVESLLIHLILVSVIFQLLVQISAYLRRGTDYFMISILILIFSFHPDVLLYIININNRTELLMLLFYASALLITLKYLNTGLKAYLFIPGVTITFLLSLLSKQNSLHFPLLLICCSLMVTTDHSRKKVILSTGLLLLIAAAAFSYLNYVLINPDLHNPDMFIRKAFSLTGTLVFVTFPLFAEQLYSFFLIQKGLASFIALLTFPVLFLGALFYNKIKILFTTFLILAIISYPRIFSLGGGRINSPLILWFIILISIILSTWKGHSKYLLLTGYLITFIASAFVLTGKINIDDTRSRKSVQGLLKLQDTFYPRKLFVALSENAAYSYTVNYYSKGEFHNSDIEGFPLILKNVFPFSGSAEVMVRASIDNNIIRFSTFSGNMFIGENPINKMDKTYKVYPLGKRDREYKTYSLEVPQNIYSDRIITFYNGSEWEIID